MSTLPFARISILGCGWLGLPLANELIRQGCKVKGSVTSEHKIPELAARGIEPFRIMVTDTAVEGEDVMRFLDSEVLIVNFPPSRRPDVETYHPAQIRQLCKVLALSPVKYVVFISSTSVYPDTNGPVTETEILPPVKSSGKALLKAESILRSQKGCITTVVRFAGLIGDDRLPGRFLAGKKDVRNGNAPINVIHRDDCIGLLVSMLQQRCFGDVFNACADLHPLRRDFYTKAAETIGMEPPVFDADPETTFKLIDSGKIKRALNYRFLHPDPMNLIQTAQTVSGTDLVTPTAVYSTVYIVGAGPGDPELLTLKAHRCITQADTLLYDNLVPDAILHLSEKAEKIYVGRKYGDASDQYDRQMHINELMKAHAAQGKKVVRLKSGDPFIFGRAIEEIRYLSAHQVPYEIVPGITAGIAAANLASIPLTERSRSNSVLFCTGHTADYDFAQWEALSNMLATGTTLVMYMGLKTLPTILERLRGIDAESELWISAISRASHPDQRILTGKLHEIETLIEQEGLPMPVVFIIGKNAVPVVHANFLQEAVLQPLTTQQS